MRRGNGAIAVHAAVIFLYRIGITAAEVAFSKHRNRLTRQTEPNGLAGFGGRNFAGPKVELAGQPESYAIMQTEVTCLCGEILRSEAEGMPVKCHECGRVYVPDSDNEISSPPGKPLAETAPARIFAWGCLLPIAFALLLFGINRWLLQENVLASYLTAGGVLIFASFGRILQLNRYSNAGILKITAVILALILALSAQTFLALHRENELNEKFALPLLHAKTGTINLQSPPVLTERFLPVLINEHGARNRTEAPRIYVDLYRNLPDDVRAERPEDVHTLVIVDWFYQHTGTYQTVEILKEKMCNIYCGGCTITIVDCDSHTIIHRNEIKLPDNAPKTRPGSDTTSWYGPQPTEKDVLEFVLGLQRRKK